MDESLAINTNCAETKFGATRIKERLMHDLDLDTVIVKGLM